MAVKRTGFLVLLCAAFLMVASASVAWSADGIDLSGKTVQFVIPFPRIGRLCKVGGFLRAAAQRGASGQSQSRGQIHAGSWLHQGSQLVPETQV
jgi:hypothetical protein